MSALDQPILIANCNYHVGHQMSFRAAEEQGFFREEGLSDYIYECGGIVPGPFEATALAPTMKERGIDIATAVNVETIVQLRAQGADLYAVGAWRHMPRVRLYAAPHIKTLADMRGARIGQREAGGITALFFGYWLGKAGIDAERDITWVEDAIFAYRRDRAHIDALLNGQVDAVQSAPPFSQELEQKGCHLILDSAELYPGGKPGKVIVATQQTIEKRAEELSAFLRGNIRGFWFVRDPDNFAFLQDLEVRYRKASHHEQERKLRMVTNPEHLEEWIMPVTGWFTREALERAIDEMVALGQIERPISVDEVVRDGPVTAAFKDLSSRPALQAACDKALAAAKKHGC
ncbi:MAG TPA: ABC transporter substrate-binding protein [Chloroflexota bacterium]|nr:ABC transporter substrate-binding protein [Chloroflexota bacterium]